MGYRRIGNKIGVRNHVIVLPTVACAKVIAGKIKNNVEGSILIQNDTGCGQLGKDREQTWRILKGYCSHPNVGGILIVSLGCEQIVSSKLKSIAEEKGKIAGEIIIQNVGGAREAINKGTEKLERIWEKVNKQKREKCLLKDLIFGLECGGSDTTSGLIANPFVGKFSNKIIKNGGTVILSETTELIGAEHILARRIKDKTDKSRLLKMVQRVENRAREQGEDLKGSQPAPGNIAGGITTIEEKSLGCIYKAGTFPIDGVLEYGEVPHGAGLYFMDTPGQDIESVTGMVGGGVQMVLFTTGQGTPVGNPVTPVIKITGNSRTYYKMRDFIDVNTGDILANKRGMEEVFAEFLEFVLETANGQPTRAEVLGQDDFNINRIGVTL